MMPKICLLNKVPATSILRNMGYIRDQDGIINRLINEEGEWNDHLNKSKNFIIECINDTSAKNIAILGSGWLLDVPVKYLLENNIFVSFFDIRHPGSVINKYRKQSNFSFFEVDITGGLISNLYSMLKSGEIIKDTEIQGKLVIPDFALNDNFDLVISLNLLNQLDILLIDYLKSKTDISIIIENYLREQIQQKHINFLLQNRASLITDYEELSLDLNDNIVGRKPLIFSKLPENKTCTKWTWHFDNKMKYHSEYKTFFNVIATKLY